MSDTTTRPSATRIDLLLTKPSNRAPMRVGDIGINAPYVILSVSNNDMILPMPNNVSSQGSILWDQTDFTPSSPLGASVVGGYNKENSVIDALKAGLSGGADKAGMNVASKIGGALGIDAADDYIRHKQGKVVNANKEMTFKGVGFRSFTMEFDFIPLNKNEGKNVKEFIKFFQEHCLPDYADAEHTYWSYPSAWNIKFSKSWLPNYMTSYLTDYSINYGGVGKMVAHEDSAVQTNITLTFTESMPHTASRVRGGYNG